MDYLRHNLGIRHQHKTIPSHACSIGFKVSTIKVSVVEERNNLKQITIFLQSNQLEKHFRILKTKHSVNIPQEMIFNHWGIQGQNFPADGDFLELNDLLQQADEEAIQSIHVENANFPIHLN